MQFAFLKRQIYLNLLIFIFVHENSEIKLTSLYLLKILQLSDAAFDHTYYCYDMEDNSHQLEFHFACSPNLVDYIFDIFT